MREDITLLIARQDESIKQAHKRIDELQKTVEAFHELVSNVSAMVVEMQYMKNDIKSIKHNIDEYHTSTPNKLIFNAKNAVITGIVGALLGALLTLILK